jgi:hypothetical protein
MNKSSELRAIWQATMALSDRAERAGLPTLKYLFEMAAAEVEIETLKLRSSVVKIRRLNAH